jgi:hypothetical protein
MTISCGKKFKNKIIFNFVIFVCGYKKS